MQIQGFPLHCVYVLNLNHQLCLVSFPFTLLLHIWFSSSQQSQLESAHAFKDDLFAH